MSPRKRGFFERLFRRPDRVVPETSPVLHRTLCRAVDDLDRKFAARRAGDGLRDDRTPRREDEPARAS